MNERISELNHVLNNTNNLNINNYNSIKKAIINNVEYINPFIFKNNTDFVKNDKDIITPEYIKNTFNSISKQLGNNIQFVEQDGNMIYDDGNGTKIEYTEGQFLLIEKNMGEGYKMVAGMSDKSYSGFSQSDIFIFDEREKGTPEDNQYKTANYMERHYNDGNVNDNIVVLTDEIQAILDAEFKIKNI